MDIYKTYFAIIKNPNTTLLFHSPFFSFYQNQLTIKGLSRILEAFFSIQSTKHWIYRTYLKILLKDIYVYMYVNCVLYTVKQERQNE